MLHIKKWLLKKEIKERKIKIKIIACVDQNQ